MQCRVCGCELHEGDFALYNGIIKEVIMCHDCFHELTKKDAVEWMGGYWATINKEN